MELFESYLAEAGLRAKSGEYDVIYEDIKKAFEKPTQTLFFCMRRSIKAFNKGDQYYAYAQEFEISGQRRNLFVTISHIDADSCPGAYFCNTYSRNPHPNTIEVQVNFELLYKNFNEAKKAKELILDEDMYEKLISTVEHEMTHYIQYRLRKLLEPNRNPFHNYSDEVIDIEDEDTLEYQIAYLVYFLFNDIEWEAQLTTAAHKNNAETTEILTSYFINAMGYLICYEKIYNEKFKWPADSAAIKMVFDDFADAEEEGDFEDDIKEDSKKAFEYVVKVMKNHYKPEYAYRNELKKAGIPTDGKHKRLIAKFVKEHPRTDKYWVNLFIRECDRRYSKFIKKYNKLVEFYINIAKKVQ